MNLYQREHASSIHEEHNWREIYEHLKQQTNIEHDKNVKQLELSVYNPLLG